jgi:hypothetical protein
LGKTAVIESGHELPEPPATVLSYGIRISLPDTIRKLEPGQSFVVDNHAGRMRALQVGYELKIGLMSRKEDQDGTERYRIWRKHE